jgi:hypothetical protein
MCCVQHDYLYFDSVRCAIIVLYITLNSFVMVRAHSLSTHPSSLGRGVCVCDSRTVTRNLSQSRVLCTLASCSRICCARHFTSCTYIHKCSGAGGSAARLDEPLQSRTRGLFYTPPPITTTALNSPPPPKRVVVRSEEESEGNGHAESDSDESTSKPHSKSTRDGAPPFLPSCFAFIYLFILKYIAVSVSVC